MDGTAVCQKKFSDGGGSIEDELMEQKNAPKIWGVCIAWFIKTAQLLTYTQYCSNDWVSQV